MVRDRKKKLAALLTVFSVLAFVALMMPHSPLTLPHLTFPSQTGLDANMELLQLLTGPGEGDAPVFAQPMAAAFDRDGNLFVADTGHHRIVVFNRDGEYLFAIGGPGAAFPAGGVAAGWQPGRFNYPYGLDVGEDGRLYIADMLNRRIQIYDVRGQFLDWFPKEQVYGEDLFPRDVVMRQGLVYIANPFQVMVYTPEGSFVRSFGKPGRGPGEFWQLNGLEVGACGTIFVSDSMNQRLQAFNQKGEFLWAYPAAGMPGDALSQPRQIAMSASGHLLVADKLGDSIRVFSQAGELLATLGARKLQQLRQPNGVAVSFEGLLAVVERANNRVQILRLPEDLIKRGAEITASTEG
jgi:sugar lactone lactonase YvrE